METLPIFDGHLDSLQKIYLAPGEPPTLLERLSTGHFDLPRAREGRFAGGLFSIFVPPRKKWAYDRTVFPAPDDERFNPLESPYAEQIAANGIHSLHRLAHASRGGLKVIGAAGEIPENMEIGAISALAHFEGAEPIRPDLSNLEGYYENGLRSVGLVWCRENAFGHGVRFRYPGSPDDGPGLSAAGEALVRACNRLGILVDVSHLTEKGFWDVARISSAPLVATHSCMHAITPASRNLTDRQLDAISASGGVVGINFCTGFIRDDGRLSADTPLSDLVRHFRYAVERMGIDHVAFGSDFDGAVIPEKIGDVSGLPRILAALEESGFGPDELRRLAHGNWLRILTQTLK
jgi:membrane dipeptidase